MALVYNDDDTYAITPKKSAVYLIKKRERVSLECLLIESITFIFKKGSTTTKHNWSFSYNDDVYVNSYQFFVKISFILCFSAYK